MSRLTLQSLLPICVYFFLSTALLHSSAACPLPSNATCTECDVLRHERFTRNKQLLHFDLTVELDLTKSVNTANKFSHEISTEEEDPDFLFASARLGDSVSSCYGTEEEASTGSACTNFVNMTGPRQPGCTWNYTCDYSAHRFPQYIWKAECATAPSGYRAHPIYYEIPTLTLNPTNDSGCLHFQEPQAVYRWELEKVQVGCTCVPIE